MQTLSQTVIEKVREESRQQPSPEWIMSGPECKWWHLLSSMQSCRTTLTYWPSHSLCSTRPSSTLNQSVLKHHSEGKQKSRQCKLHLHDHPPVAPCSTYVSVWRPLSNTCDFITNFGHRADNTVTHARVQLLLHVLSVWSITAFLWPGILGSTSAVTMGTVFS